MAALPPSRVLVMGATGELGRLIVKASLESGHATFAFVRPTSFSHPSKASLLQSFQSQGATLLQGTLEDYKSLVEAIEKVDIVISSINFESFSKELDILVAIQEAGNIKRFVMIEYIAPKGLSSAGKLYGIQKSIWPVKEKVKKAVTASKVPFTCIITYGFGSYYIASLGQLDCRSPPMHQVVIAGNGDLKAYMVAEEDVAKLTMKASVDPRAVNKNFHLRLPKNHISQNDLVSIWESKVGVQLEKIYESEEDMRKALEEDPNPPLTKIVKHFSFAKGGHNTPLYKDEDDVEVMDLYPDYEYVEASQYLDRFVK